MNQRKRKFLHSVAVAVCALSTFSLRAQSLPDAKSLLKGAASALQKYRGVEFVIRTTMQVESGGASHTSEKSFASVVPDKVRIESRSSGFTSLIVSDGVTTTAYSGQGKYARVSGTLSSLTAAMGLNTSDATDGAKSRTLGEETIEIDGHTYSCWVVETTVDAAAMAIPQMGLLRASLTGAIRTWIDKGSGIDVQSTGDLRVAIAGKAPVITTTREVKSQLRLNESIDDAVFSFTPPADAVEVPATDYFSSMLGDFRGRALEGKGAPAFELKGLGGSSYNLAAMAGHPVVLDFWATWCIPCRATIPILNDFYTKHKKDGIIVIGVNMGETPEPVKKFVEHQGIQYPVAFGADTNIGDTFQVSVFPTLVLIDPHGKIQSYEMGFDTEESLRQTLAQFSAEFAK